LSAGFTLALFIQFFSADAHPADQFGRVADHKGVVGNVFCDHRPRSYEGVFTDGVAADDGAVGPQGGAFPDKGRADLAHLGNFRPWVVDVRKDHRGAAENAVFKGNAFINADVILNLALVADDCIIPKIR